MLVVMRKSGQSFTIGKDIEIQILEVQPNGVKIGISAPKDLLILRKELLDEARLVNRGSVIKSVRITLTDLKETLGENE